MVGLCGLSAVTPAGSAAAALPPGCVLSGSTVTCTFSETGGSQDWAVPSGVTSASFVVDGASGSASADSSEAGGKGGQVSAKLGSLSAGQVFTIEVGGAGSLGGFDGGGTGGGDGAGGGGGSSSVSLGSTVELVAGGGGGGAEDVTSNSCTGPVTTMSGAGGAGGQFGLDGNPGGTFTCSTETLNGGGGGNAGGDQSPLVPGAGGTAGEPDGMAISTCGAPPGFIGGVQGGSATGSTGGNGATGGGGGGGGYVGGGGGGSPAHDATGCTLTGGRAGGGGGSSYSASTASGVSFATGVSVPSPSGNGQVTITYSTLPAYQPDAQVKLASDTSYLGVGIFNTTGAGQTRTTTTAPGKSATFDLRLVNAGTHSDAIAVKGCNSLSGLTVKYFKGTTDVTTEVTAGTYKTRTLAAGASRMLKLKIAVSSTATAGKTHTCAVTASSNAAPTSQDVVKAKVKVG